MQFEELVAWVRRQHESGQDPVAIQAFLLHQGYPYQEAKDAVQAGTTRKRIPPAKNNTLLIVAIVIIAVLTGVAFYFSFFGNPWQTISTTGISEAALTYTECGEDTACFQTKFNVCEPAHVRYSIGQVVAYEYVIEGPVHNGCKVRTSYPVNLNPDWVDKPMTCVLSPEDSFEAAYLDIFESFSTHQPLGNCTGPLYALLYNESLLM